VPLLSETGSPGVTPPRHAVLALLLYAPVILCGCKADLPEEQPPRPVRVLEVRSAGVTRERTFSGTARASLESDLSFRVSGTIQTVAIKVGDFVRKGQLLAAIDPIEYQLRAEDARASLVRARAEARNAEANLDRIRKLYENNNASQNDLDFAQTSYETAVAAVNSVEKRLELAENELGYTKLTAPLPGAIADVLVEVNENTSPGQPIARLSSGTRAEVEVAVPEALITRVREGQEVEVTFDALPGQVFAAVVTEVGVTPVGTATTFPATAQLLEETRDVRPGMVAEVTCRFAGPPAPGLFLVPPDAVQEDREGRFVYVAEKADEGFGVVRRRAVRAGDVTGEGIEVLDGLAEGDLLVTAGWSRISDGQQVSLPDAGGAGR
jgi:RND family efflux transporter MFP subunit